MATTPPLPEPEPDTDRPVPDPDPDVLRGPSIPPHPPTQSGTGGESQGGPQPGGAHDGGANRSYGGPPNPNATRSRD